MPDPCKNTCKAFHCEERGLPSSQGVEVAFICILVEAWSKKTNMLHTGSENVGLGGWAGKLDGARPANEWGGGGYEYWLD